MDLSRRAIQTNDFFQTSYLFSNYWLKTEKYSNEYRVVNIDPSAMCYIPMNSSQRALQTNAKLFINFEFAFELLANNQTNSYTSLLIKLQCVKGKSMDLSPQALQTNGKFFFQTSESFFEFITIFQNNSGVGFMHTRWGGICAD